MALQIREYLLPLQLSLKKCKITTKNIFYFFLRKKLLTFQNIMKTIRKLQRQYQESQILKELKILKM